LPKPLYPFVSLDSITQLYLHVQLLVVVVVVVINTDVIRSRGSSDSIVSGYGLEDRAIEFRYPAEARGQTGS
jgi:hypothetical protein